MPRKKKPPLTFVERMQKIAAANLSTNKKITPKKETEDTEQIIESLSLRVKKILGLTNKREKRNGYMMFFVMYDIENDKVRGLIYKYLVRKGCVRIQRSIFLADAPINTYEEIKSDLSEVQATYDNHDSIIVLPISADYVNMMKIIGKKIEIDIITHSKNTLFF